MGDYAIVIMENKDTFYISKKEQEKLLKKIIKWKIKN